MPLRRLRIHTLRCLNDVDIMLDPRRTYLIGPNGAGKTSVLEAIYLLGRGRSFRTRQNRRLVQHRQEGFSVYGETTAENGAHRLGVQFMEGRLDVRIDGEAAPGMADLAEHLAVHVIDPRLHQLIEAGPSERRRYMDSGVFHVEHHYLAAWRAYRRALAQRNAALKTSNRRAEVEAWTDAFLAAGDRIDETRSRYVSKLSTAVSQTAGRLLGRELEIEYRPGWSRSLTLAEALEESWASDQATGFSQVGPHRADLNIRLDATDVKDAASRGQQKLVAAALVISQVQLYESLRGAQATVLVDDPVAELDRSAVGRLLAELDELRSQLVITALTEEALHPRKGCPVFHVEQGNLQAVLY